MSELQKHSSSLSMLELESNNNETPKLITFLSLMLRKVAESNDRNLNFQTQKISVFHGLTKPTISIQTYLDRIFKFANCSPSCFVIAYVYLDRLTQKQPSLSVNSFNVHRLLITSIMVAAKFMDDMYYNNAYYAKVGGISTKEMNYLEVDFLFGLGFHLNVTPNTFQTYCSYLQSEMMMLQSSLNTIGIKSLKLQQQLCFNNNTTKDQDDQSNSLHNQQLTV